MPHRELESIDRNVKVNKMRINSLNKELDNLTAYVFNLEDKIGKSSTWHTETTTSIPEVKSEFKISVTTQDLTPAQVQAFDRASARWSEIIIGDLPPVTLMGREIDDLHIDAQSIFIDGPGHILGQAAPLYVRTDSGLPISGIMSFDSADLEKMEEDGSLENVIIHEMGHVLGLGTLWSRMGLIRNEGGDDPIFTGDNATREWEKLNDGYPISGIPIENTGGPGTRDGHWRDSIFGNELMTGFLGQGVNLISRVTVGALEDMGYEVNYGAADDFELSRWNNQTRLKSYNNLHRV